MKYPTKRPTPIPKSNMPMRKAAKLHGRPNPVSWIKGTRPEKPDRFSTGISDNFSTNMFRSFRRTNSSKSLYTVKQIVAVTKIGVKKLNITQIFMR